LLINLNLFSQTLDPNHFNIPILEDDFNSNISIFRTIQDSYNQIGVEDGELILNRKHSDSDFIILANKPISQKVYKIKTSITLETSKHQKSYCGIVLNMPKDHNQSVAIEINSNLEYRLRKLLPNTSEFISGSVSNFGWVKHHTLQQNSNANQIEVVSNKGNYDLYINQEYINSFKVSGPDFGEFGFIIGPNSKAKIENVSVYKQNLNLKQKETTVSKIANNNNLLHHAAKKQIGSPSNNLTYKENEQYKNQQTKINDLLKKEQEKNLKLRSEIKKMKTDFLDFKKGYIEMEASHSKLSNEVKQLRKVENERQSIQKEFQWTSELLDKSNQELIKVKKELKHYQNQNESTIDYKKEIGTLHKKVQKQKLDLEQKEKELSLLNSKYQQKIKDEKAIYESLAKFESSTINQQKSSITQRANQQLLINKNKIDELNSKIESLIKQNHDLLSKNQMLEVQVEEQKKISSQFAESFSLEKEKNKQYQNEIMSFYMENEPTEIKDSVVYRVQLGIFDDNIDIEGLEDLTTIYTNAQQIIYISGKFKDFITAKKYLEKMREKGFQDSFIVKF
jgi:hypothetical protein